MTTPDGYTGEVRAFAGAAVPNGWLPCDGQHVSIHSYPHLYALIGTRYGGNGLTVFAVPDLRGAAAIGIGSSGTHPIRQGTRLGTAKIVLGAANFFYHAHGVNAISVPAVSTNVPSERSLLTVASTPEGKVVSAYQSESKAPGKMAAEMVEPVGKSEPHENRQPYLAVTFAICVHGIFPMRP